MSVVDAAPKPREDLGPAYGHLLDNLESIAGMPASTDKELASQAYGALAALASFLIGDPAVRERRLAVPIFDLVEALGLAMDGGKPALFSHPSPGRKSSDVQHGVRAQIILALQGLEAAGLPPGKAATWLEQELSHVGIKHDGQPITAATLADWRAKIGGNSPPRVEVAHQQLRDQPQPVADTIDKAKLFALGRLKSIAETRVRLSLKPPVFE